MTLLELLRTLQQHGIDLLEEAHGLSKWELADAGLPLKTAHTYICAAATYFGTTRYKRQQQKAVDAARNNRHSVNTLVMVERFVRKCETDAQAWKLRVELLSLPLNHDEIRAHAQQHTQKPKQQPAEAQLKITRNRNTRSQTLHLTAPEREIAALVDALHVDADPQLPAAQGRARALLQRLAGTASAAASPGLTPIVIIGLDDAVAISQGRGDDVELALSNGSRISGKEFVEESLADTLLVGLYHPVTGPVNLYRSQRKASFKQRILTAADNPMCPWPDCNVPADRCETHHIDAWSHGGQTNIDRLSTLCPYHNGVNDDDPNAPPKRGRIDRIDGTITWRPPGGGQPRRNTDPINNLGATSLVHSGRAGNKKSQTP